MRQDRTEAVHRSRVLPWLGLLSLAGCPVGWSYQSAPISYPLVGEHVALGCVDCHTTGAPFLPLPTTCASCHEAARPVPHYDGDCGTCHTPFGWDDVVVDHSFFELTDSHALPCESCHTSGTFEGLSADCESCHEADRPADHFIGTGCGECHVPTVWSDATFDHDPFFPLPHHGVSDCASCHLVPGVYTAPSCTSCHEHNAGDTNDDHDEVANYQYTDAACIQCHPDGGE